MYSYMVRGLIGELNFVDIINGLPIEFMDWPEAVKESMWQSVIGKINDGEKDIQILAKYARQWVRLYPIVKSSIHRAISKSII